MTVGRVGELEISHDLRWQRRAWIIRRITWLALCLLLVGAVLGVFGTGVLGQGRHSEAGSVGFERFTRFGAPTEMTVRAPAAAVEGGTVEVAINSEYIGDMQIDAVTPQPDKVESLARETVFTFSVGRPPGPIMYHLTPREAGIQEARVRIGGAEAHSYTQIVYP